eukprot:1810315-Pyramimonas_sp.AAC.1
MPPEVRVPKEIARELKSRVTRWLNKVSTGNYTVSVSEPYRPGAPRTSDPLVTGRWRWVSARRTWCPSPPALFLST